MTETNAVVPLPRKSITMAMADRYGMMPDAFEATVRATCFPANPPATKEEFAAGMLIAHKLDLNPVTKEIHFARPKGGGVQALIGVDGWYVMANKHPAYDGCEFVDHKDAKGEKVIAITCRIYRKDRTRTTEVTEYMDECKRGSEAWKLTPTRMLRHRAFGQCARLAFSFAGVMDHDEFERWQENDRPAPRPLASLPLPPEPEIIQPEPAEPDRNYLDDLNETMGAAQSLDDLRTIWGTHLQHAEDVALSLEDKESAEEIYQKHHDRIAP